MDEVDAMRGAKPANGGGLFLTDFPAKIRVFTLDPLLAQDKFGNTRYAFVVWHFDEDKPKILNKGPSFYNRFLAIHNDEDWGADIRKIDIKITAEGSGKDTRYSISPLPKSESLTNDQIREAAKIRLEDVIKNGVRLSEINKGARVPTIQLEPEFTQSDAGEMDGAEVNLNDIPF